MVKHLLSIAAIAALAVSPAYANLISSNSLPENLQYKNKPISPICFGVTSYNEFKQEEGIIDLTKCIEDASAPQVVNKKLADKGYYGFDVMDNSKAFTLSTHYYRAFNASPGFYFVESLSSGDQAGVFSTLDLVTRVNPTTLKVKTIATGDRCNLGINSIDSNNGNLTLKVNLTPYSFMSLANPDYMRNEAIQKLSNCETCCVGKAVYKVDIGGHKMLQYVEIDKPAETSNAKESCFDKLLAKQTSADGKPVMINKDNLVTFSQTFNQTCGKNES